MVSLSNVLFPLCWIIMAYRASVDGSSVILPYWQNECIVKHNNYRAEHKTGGLVWSSDLEQKAKSWAEYLATSQLVSRGEKGENLFLTSGQQLPNCTDIVDVFYNEINNYDYNNPGLSKNTERFSQVLWKNTVKLGVGYSKRQDGKYIVVFRYKPPGNYNTKSAYQENVLPPPVKVAGAGALGYQITITTLAMVIASGLVI